MAVSVGTIVDTLSDAEVRRLKAGLADGNIADPRNVTLLQHLTTVQREEFARRSQVPVLYFGDEVPAVMTAEEQAALSAAPRGFALSVLNGLNIGAGGRAISPFLTPVDIFREPGSSTHHSYLSQAILALPDALPFRDNSVDFIVALHMLEHVSNPVEVVDHWLDVVKPGGGIGIILPDWRYNWDARRDKAPLGHKWNSTPELLRSMFEQHWSSRCSVQQLATYRYRLSFDVVLRKHGEFRMFSPPDVSTIRSGYQLDLDGIFLG